MSARAELSEHVSDLANYRLPPSIQRELDTHIDAYRAEVLAGAAIDLLCERPKYANRSIFCDGITHAADRLTEWAKAGEKATAAAAPATPDAEAYDGELAMARSLLRTLRAVVRDDASAEKQRAEVRQLLHEHASDEAAARAGEKATPEAGEVR